MPRYTSTVPSATPRSSRRYLAYSLSIWLAPEDLVQLVRIGLEHPDIRYEVLYGASDNARIAGRPQKLGEA